MLRHMRPRTAYRVSVVGLPIMLAMFVLALADGLWLLAVGAAIAVCTTAYNLVQSRRIGMHWNGPKTFREFRALQRRRSESKDDEITDALATRGAERVSDLSRRLGE